VRDTHGKLFSVSILSMYTKYRASTQGPDVQVLHEFLVGPIFYRLLFSGESSTANPARASWVGSSEASRPMVMRAARRRCDRPSLFRFG
jgi:hypothetical protein